MNYFLSLFKWVVLSTVVLFNFTTIQAQSIDTLVYTGISVVPFNQTVANEPIEELSGIEYTGFGNRYYVIPQSWTKAHVFLCSISFLEEQLLVEFDSVIYLDHGKLEAESIRINPKSGEIFIAEEDKGVSYIYKINNQNRLDKIYTSIMPQRYNSGFEGLCFNKTGDVMFMSLERPQTGYKSQIISYNLKDSSEVTYNYTLDNLPGDKRKDNGIAELLSLNDSTLLVVERAYLGRTIGNSIRVYKALIPKEGNEIKKIKLLTDFSASPHIDNIEGVSFSSSGKELIFISDNNGNAHQQTLFISMKLE